MHSHAVNHGDIVNHCGISVEELCREIRAPHCKGLAARRNKADRRLVVNCVTIGIVLYEVSGDHGFWKGV